METAQYFIVLLVLTILYVRYAPEQCNNPLRQFVSTQFFIRNFTLTIAALHHVANDGVRPRALSICYYYISLFRETFLGRTGKSILHSYHRRRRDLFRIPPTGPPCPHTRSFDAAGENDRQRRRCVTRPTVNRVD